jgi:phosphoribosylaminoimidazole-succinocarboxamide synthase
MSAEVCCALGRYWLADSYEARHAAGQEPENIDKEFLRLWFRDNCDPYADEVRIITRAFNVCETSASYTVALHMHV